MRRRVLLAALAAGVLAGAVGAAVQADDRSGSSGTTARAGAASPVPIAPPRDTSRLPDGRFDPSRVHYRVERPRIALTVPDPGGGPDWAVRLFDAERLTIRKPVRSLRGALVVGRNRCVQLGRLSGGRFGWVFGDGRFRATPGIEHTLLQCTSRLRPRAMALFATTLSIPEPAAPEPSGSLVWGFAPGAGSVTVSGTGAADGAIRTRRGVFLKLAGPGARARVEARVRAGDETVRLGPSPGLPLPSRFGGKLRFPKVIPGTQRLEARAPDPAGGPGLALPVAESREGPPCVGSAAEVVGDRLGDVDLRLGLFRETTITSGACRPLSTAPTRERACDIGTGFGNADELEGEDAFLRQARIERRLQPGRTSIHGQCHPDVERVTIQTPRDVRTLVPSPVGRAFLAVYDGSFPAGEMIVTARLRGGGTWRERVPLGF